METSKKLYNSDKFPGEIEGNYDDSLEKTKRKKSKNL